MSASLTLARRGPFLAVLLAGVIVLGLGGCGRRGLPEAPGGDARAAPAANQGAGGSQTTLATRPVASVENAPEDELADEDRVQSVSPQPTPGPTSRRRVPYVVPKEPFILDPLL